MWILRYIFIGAFVFNLLVLADVHLGGARLLAGWPVPTFSEMCLCAVVIALACRKTIVYVNTGGGGRWQEREHCEV